MTLIEFIAARLAEEPGADQLLRREFPAAYASPGVYQDAPWTYAGRERLAVFAKRWEGHPDYRPASHAPMDEARRVSVE